MVAQLPGRWTAVAQEPGQACLRHGRHAARQVAANIALVKNLTLHGVFWGSYMQHAPAVLQGSLRELLSWLADGKISVPVSHRQNAPHSPPACWMLFTWHPRRA